MGPGCSHWTGSRLQAGAPSAGKAGGSRESKCQGNNGHNPDDYMDPRAEEANHPIKPELFQPEKQWVTWKTKPRRTTKPSIPAGRKVHQAWHPQTQILVQRAWERNIYIPLPCVISNVDTLETAMGTLGLSQPPSKATWVTLSRYNQWHGDHAKQLLQFSKKEHIILSLFTSLMVL